MIHLENNKKALSEAQKNIADELNKIQIDQLHKATLNFSNNSMETKKLCVTAQIAVYTLLAGIYKENSSPIFAIALVLLGMLVPILFYFVDVFLYFYQDRLRENMSKQIDEIKKRNGLEIQPPSKKKNRLFRSLFNGSQTLYFGLIINSIVAPVLIKICIKLWRTAGVC